MPSSTHYGINHYSSIRYLLAVSKQKKIFILNIKFIFFFIFAVDTLCIFVSLIAMDLAFPNCAY